MFVVALGHWVNVAILRNDAGDLTGTTVLELHPGFGWLTWIFQVMPAFFLVGGFASACSLDSAASKAGAAGKDFSSADWIQGRLRRMMTPTTWLARFWTTLITLAAAIHFSGVFDFDLLELAVQGAYVGAIPLWFLANYTIDTAIAPFTHRLWRRSPVKLIGGLLAVFTVAEIANLNDIPYLPQINWVIGWLLFQITGFAWQDGKLTSGAKLVAAAAAAWALALALVTVGPYPVLMLHIGGLDLSPTHPPTLALLAFGTAYNLTVVALAPAIDRWLTRSRRAWKATAVLGTISMSVYLWHATAGLFAGVALQQFVDMTGPETLSSAWWGQKALLVIVASLLLGGIVATVKGAELKGMVAGAGASFRFGLPTLLIAAATLSAGIKMWSSPSALLMVGLVLVHGSWFVASRTRPLN